MSFQFLLLRSFKFSQNYDRQFVALIKWIGYLCGFGILKIKRKLFLILNSFTSYLSLFVFEIIVSVYFCKKLINIRTYILCTKLVKFNL